MADEGNALVVWGSTGRRLQFSVQDLKMPEHLRSDPHFHFYEKQWDAVASFWFNRVLKEAPLQHLPVEDIVERIRDDIAKRWERRRTEQNIHKKRKRLLQGGTPAGTPAPAVLLTNVIALDAYEAASPAAQRELAAAVVERVAAVAKDPVTAWHVLVDDAAEEAPPTKAARAEQAKVEETRAGPSSAGPFDDRVAVVCTLSSSEKAATAVAHLHGSTFDGRRVLCRFWQAPA